MDWYTRMKVYDQTSRRISIQQHHQTILFIICSSRPLKACGVMAPRLSFELGDQGSSPSRTSTQGLKITEEKVLPLLNTSKW